MSEWCDGKCQDCDDHLWQRESKAARYRGMVESLLAALEPMIAVSGVSEPAVRRSAAEHAMAILSEARALLGQEVKG